MWFLVSICVACQGNNQVCRSNIVEPQQSFYNPCSFFREFDLFLTGTTEYTLTKEDVGRRLAFVYIPMNFEGQYISLKLVDKILVIHNYNLLKMSLVFLIMHLKLIDVYSYFTGQEGKPLTTTSQVVKQGISV